MSNKDFEETDFEIEIKRSRNIFSPFRGKKTQTRIDFFFKVLMPIIGLVSCTTGILQGISINQTKSRINVPIVGYFISLGCNLTWVLYSIWVKDFLVFFNAFTFILTGLFVIFSYYFVADD